MARSYPIWNEIESCIYKGDKSYGVRNDGLVSVKVGTGAKNSHSFIDHKVTHRQLSTGERVYRFSVDGVCIKEVQIDKQGNFKVIRDVLKGINVSENKTERLR